jgi:hypothetical protein
MFDNPVIRNRIGEVIAKAVAKRRKSRSRELGSYR